MPDIIEGLRGHKREARAALKLQKLRAKLTFIGQPVEPTETNNGRWMMTVTPGYLHEVWDMWHRWHNSEFDGSFSSEESAIIAYLRWWKADQKLDKTKQ